MYAPQIGSAAQAGGLYFWLICLVDQLLLGATFSSKTYRNEDLSPPPRDLFACRAENPK